MIATWTTADSHLPVEVTERSPRRTLHDARTPPISRHHRSAADVIVQHARGMQRAPRTARSPRPADGSSDAKSLEIAERSIPTQACATPRTSQTRGRITLYICSVMSHSFPRTSGARTSTRLAATVPICGIIK